MLSGVAIWLCFTSFLIDFIKIIGEILRKEAAVITQIAELKFQYI